MSLTVYHYARIEDWEGIRQGSWKSRNKPGLGASRRMGKQDEEAFETTAVWALLEPMPEEWTDNPDFKDSWKILTNDIGNLLLEIDVPEGTEAYVIDRGHIEGFLNSARPDVSIPERHVFPTRGDAERAYLKSRIPLAEYLEKADGLDYTLPEVIFPSHVPIERISVSERQPLIDRLWEHYKETQTGARLIRSMGEIPELRGWLDRHREEIELAEETRPKQEFKFL